MSIRSMLPLAAVLSTLLVAGCVTVAPLSSAGPSGAAPSEIATAAPIASTGPAQTRRPCGPGDTRRRCRTSEPLATPELTLPPTDAPTDTPTDTPTDPPTEPPTDPPTAPPQNGTGADTDIVISTTAIDFGQVNVGSTASVSVTLTNTGADPFGPINMFGGAPPTAEFNASQNCQAQTLPAGGSCMVNYSFSPGATGTFTDTSSFTVSETASQSDGENFDVSLVGVGVAP